MVRRLAPIRMTTRLWNRCVWICCRVGSLTLNLRVLRVGDSWRKEELSGRLEFVPRANNEFGNSMIIARAVEYFLPVWKIGAEVLLDGDHGSDHKSEQFLEHRGVNRFSGILYQLEGDRIC